MLAPWEVALLGCGFIERGVALLGEGSQCGGGALISYIYA